MGAGRVLCDDVYVDACALMNFQFHPRSVGRSVDPGTTLVPRQKIITCSCKVGRWETLLFFGKRLFRTRSTELM